MAITDNVVGQVSGSMFGGILNNGMIFLLIIILISIIMGVGLIVRYYRQFNIIVMIKSKRAGARPGQDFYKIIWDKGALLKDRKNNTWYFRLFSENVDLPVPPFEVMETSNKGNVLKLLQESNEEYLFLVPDKIDREWVVMSNGKKVPIAELTLKQVEGDVAYWNVIKKRHNRKMFDSESLIMKLLPYIVPVLMFVLVIFLTWMILKNFNVLQDTAKYLKETAEIYKSMNQAQIITHAG